MILRVILIIFSVALLAACSKDVTVQDPGAAFKGVPAKVIFKKGRLALWNGDYDECIRHFEGLDSLYPFGKYAEQSQLDIIYCYYHSDDVGMTLASADRYIQLYPTNSDVAYAYYMRGLAEFYQNRSFLDKYTPTDYAQRDLEPLRKAFMDFKRVVEEYPHTKYAADAHHRMLYIRNVIALHNLEVAHFYYHRHAYVAAANRANLIVRHYQQSTAIPGALVVMTAAYQKLGQTEAAQRSLNVLKLNFPNNSSLGELERRQQALTNQSK